MQKFFQKNSKKVFCFQNYGYISIINQVKINIMIVLINCNFDGDSYAIFNKMESAMDAFKASCESGFNHKVYLVKPDSLGEEFGFGSRGEIYGAEVINEWSDDDDRESGF